MGPVDHKLAGSTPFSVTATSGRPGALPSRLFDPTQSPIGLIRKVASLAFDIVKSFAEVVAAQIHVHSRSGVFAGNIPSTTPRIDGERRVLV